MPATVALDVLDGRIQTIRTMINPGKLGHVGPVADAWAVSRELNQARRPAVQVERLQRSEDEQPGRPAVVC